MADVPTADPELTTLAAELRGITSALDRETGWFAAFARRSPAELAAWLDGRRLPPWDILADLLLDLADRHGTAAAEQGEQRLRAAYRAALRAQDAAPGARSALARRLDVLAQAEHDARLHGQQLSAAARAAQHGGRAQEADNLGVLRLWAQDDEDRARARRAETEARLVALPAPAAAVPEQPRATPPVPRPARPARPARVTRPRGARFAGIDTAAGEDAGNAADTPPVVAGPDTSATAPAVPAAPGGSRFAGATGEAHRSLCHRPTEEDHRAADAAAGRMARMRAEGGSGQVYSVMCEAVSGPAQRLPLLLTALERTGQTSEVTTLLWEAASLPPGRLAAAAEALSVAGRERECVQLLRQGAARPAAEAGAAAAELTSVGRSGEAVTLLAAMVRARSAEEAVHAALEAPAVVAPLLLDAALSVSPRHHRALASELRRAGVAP
ncbi:hypothetical protein PJ985_16870 [Streptomyces sp. ACA25]|uniref:hypothetical protein n=1 Tax=Streptomyces sp. ACA25 TaxID=3022596 RepID=UPI002306E721|nr:hypothetical protein [Streptomyces sp. ACA25]MDB1089237.1 hypothetical protein [Streptomyces sp. ACA25]